METDKVIDRASKLFKVLGDTKRLSIVVALQNKSMNVTELSKELSIEQTNLSHQLKMLRDLRIVKVRRVGKTHIYSLDDLHINELLNLVFTHIREEGSHAL